MPIKNRCATLAWLTACALAGPSHAAAERQSEPHATATRPNATGATTTSTPGREIQTFDMLLDMSARAASAAASERPASPIEPQSKAGAASAPAAMQGTIPDSLGVGAVLPTSTRDQTLRNDDKSAPWAVDSARQVMAGDGVVVINGEPDSSWFRASLVYVRENALTTLIATLSLFGLAWLFSALVQHLNTAVPRLYDVRRRRRRSRPSQGSSHHSAHDHARDGAHQSSHATSGQHDGSQPQSKRERRRRRHSRPSP